MNMVTDAPGEIVFQLEQETIRKIANVASFHAHSTNYSRHFHHMIIQNSK